MSKDVPAPRLRRVQAGDLRAELRDPVDAETLAATAPLIQRVRTEGKPALIELAERFGDLEPGVDPLVGASELKAALAGLAPEQRALLERCAGRIREFAARQRASIVEMSCEIEGGRAGHRVAPVERAGCYAPGGRFPLPSSVLMTAVTARVAGVTQVTVASPKPTQVTLAAAAIAGADQLLRVGGAQAIAALAYGIEGLDAVDVIVGPGNRWVTAAKHLVSLHVGIDMLAGPSELVVLADESADPAIIAADLLAQAEHDPDALPILVTTDPRGCEAVEAALGQQLAVLPTRATAEAALRQGYAVHCRDIESAIAVCDTLAPEHLELLVRDPEQLVGRLSHYGAVFVGERSAEVFGDYGLGPNHVLPTGRSARYRGGLSVLDFLRIRTELHCDDRLSQQLIDDCEQLARLEGLHGHAEAARLRGRSR